MKKHYLSTFYHLGAELILAFLLFQPVFSILNSPIQTPYWVIGTIASCIFIYMTGNKTALYLPSMFIIGLSAVGVAIVIGIYIPPFICLITYLMFRWRYIILNSFQDYSNKILYTTFLTGLGVISFNLILNFQKNIDVIKIIVLVYIFQLMFVLVLGYFKKMKENELSSNKSKFLIPFYVVIGIFTLAGLVLFSLRSIFYKIFFGIMGVISAILGFVLEPIVNAINLDFLMNQKEVETIVSETGNAYIEREADNSYIFDIILGVVITIIVVILVILIWKYLKRKIETISIREEVTIIQTFKDITGSFSIFQNNRLEEPKDVVRKEIFQLEKFAVKKNLSRETGESIRQWYDRLGIIVSTSYFVTYENVRYGEQNINEEEKREFLQQSKQVKDWIKRRSKEMQKEK